MNKKLINQDVSTCGVYRANLYWNGTDARVYIPGISGNVKINDMDLLPKGMFSSYEMRNTATGEAPCWVAFENGDMKRPIIVGYFGKGIRSIGGTSRVGDDGNTSDVMITTTDVTIDNNTTYYNGLIRCINGIDAGYDGDEGLDVNAPIGTPVYSPCDGVIRYSEFGHTPWGQTKWGPNRDDTCYSIGIDMNKSISYAGKNISYIFLTHLSKLIYDIPSGSGGKTVKVGEVLAYSGIANGSPHLHIGLSPTSWNPLTMQQTRDFFNSKLGERWVVGE